MAVPVRPYAELVDILRAVAAAEMTDLLKPDRFSWSVEAAAVATVQIFDGRGARIPTRQSDPRRRRSTPPALADVVRGLHTPTSRPHRSTTACRIVVAPPR
ncbi:hypothetical protein CCR87_16515 [Rhodobaculum claviforme]|uniref:Uncharacterized protein n=1 Tax=Rhodobaculum claviforme TaxID=1549854 RepID=A0A934TNP5_9RHOB|nr:hypothetical protein [Rhodobaculum claviforme]MBK5928916.1 hypothetical protein [Rhodobaculum claviforme]